ncbi:MAG: P-type conjugative transfer ATPase TrbB [Azoarcus sp.]|jgi:type IV secretion system protein VirB11|nr:P-type conjugative transfer ATPase TrbB [Azoarcus sp.]
MQPPPQDSIVIDQPSNKVHARTIEKLKRDLGHVFLGALDDPKTIEILLNADGVLWQERLGEGMKVIGQMRAAQARAVIETVAGFHNYVVTADRPLCEAEFPIDGSRFAGQLPPVVSSPTFAIRKKASAVFTLDEYVADGIMTAEQKDAIAKAVAAHRNILVIGGTGSGKTTMTNAVILQMVDCNPVERMILIEDTAEIQCKARNFVQFHTTLSVDMTMLLRTSLRMRPDRILVGEVRGKEALDLIMAWNTGHEGGVATIHANNAIAALGRLKTLVSMHRDAPADIEPLIAEAVHVVVHITKTEKTPGCPKGRRVAEIITVQGYENGAYSIAQIH